MSLNRYVWMNVNLKKFYRTGLIYLNDVSLETSATLISQISYKNIWIRSCPHILNKERKERSKGIIHSIENII